MGHPVRHSLSPLLHNAAFAALGLNWTSVAFEVSAGNVAAALDGIRALGVAGVSVTMPHEGDVEALIDERSAVAARLGAVNCVINRGGTLWAPTPTVPGSSLPWPGAAGFEPAGKRCLLIGAGGAARAVALALAGAGRAVGHGRQPDTVEGGRRGCAGRVGGARRRRGHVGEALVGEAELVVNATPVGMQGAGGSRATEWLVRPPCCGRGRWWQISSTSPARRRGSLPRRRPVATAVDGLGMLVHQAAEQLELWTGSRPRSTSCGRRHLRRLMGSLPGVHGRGFGASRSRPSREAQVHDRLFAQGVVRGHPAGRAPCAT